MAVSGGVNGGYRLPKIRGLSVAMRKSGGRKRVTLVRPTPPIFISTDPTHVNPHDLRHLCSVSNHSCHRFPNLSSDGQVEPVDVQKLRTAISHSSVVLSVFAKAEVISYFSSSSSDFPKSPSPEFSKLMGIGGDWFQRVIPVTPFNGQLVGFGRAVSDCGLTASIYDVMCLPGDPTVTRNGNRPDDCSKDYKSAHK